MCDYARYKFSYHYYYIIIVKFGREELAPNILLTAKVENFWGHLGNSAPENPKKLRKNLENARK